MHKLFNNDYCISFLFALMRHLGASVGVLNVFWPSLRSALSGVVTVLVILSQPPSAYGPHSDAGRQNPGCSYTVSCLGRFRWPVESFICTTNPSLFLSDWVEVTSHFFLLRLEQRKDNQCRTLQYYFDKHCLHILMSAIILYMNLKMVYPIRC